MKEFISYHPGSMGNFIKLLICSGIDGYTFEKSRLFYNNDIISIINDNGEVIQYGGQSAFDLFLTNVFYKNFVDIWTEDSDNLIEPLSRIYCKYKKRESNILDISGGHLHTSMYTKGSLDNTFKFMNCVGINKVIFITINNNDELNVCKDYRKNKRPESNDVHTIETHLELNESLKTNLRKDDCILTVSTIFQKDKLKDFLLINIDNWSDTYFDIIYDSYMNLQDYTLKV